jgi:hypothetical protein
MAATPCLTCGQDVGEPLPSVLAIKKRLGMPLTPQKRCPECLCKALLSLADEPDDLDAEVQS